jgi:predicted O-linked N-acetylglucosamine transferase (SPINDLY family)/Flp pilus assembly protein TadD
MIEALFNNGCESMAKGEFIEAIRLFRKALALNASIPEIWNNLGISLFNQGNRRDAIDAFRQAIGLAPNMAEAYNNMGRAFAELGEIEEGVKACQEAVKIDPLYSEGHNTLGIILMKADRHREALRHFSNACAISPGFAWAWQNRGNAQKEIGWLKAASSSYRKALSIQQSFEFAMQGIALVCQQQGDPDKAVSFFRKAARISPNDPDIHSNLIMSMNYSSNCNQEAITNESILWGFLHGSFHQPFAEPSRMPVLTRHLRIGYVSADFHRHPVGTFLKEVIKNHDKSAFEIICFQNDLHFDEITAELKRFADQWHIITGLTDDEAAHLISSMGVDILVDLSGHTKGNRLTLFALKPAPIQATWLGYFNTTGLTAIDFLITDSITINPGEDAFYPEHILRLPGCRLCYSPPVPAPLVDVLPSVENGFVTFGSFNNIVKITSEVLSLWARVLKSIPDSKLILKWKSFELSWIRKKYLARFAAHGISPERIECRGASSHFLALSEYNDIDIALDTFPYNGGITSCEALWMGVPVVTLLGSTPIGRQTASFLSVMEMSELIAKNEEQYIAIAGSLAGDVQQLARIRDGLRERMESSSLCDGKQFTKGLEEAFRTMVREKALPDSVAGNTMISKEASTQTCRRIIKYRREVDNLPQKRLKVCYLYSKATTSEMVAALREIIPLHDRKRFEIFVYYDNFFPEEADLLFSGPTVKQRATCDLNDHLFSTLLNREGIDVLVELIGKGEAPRLNVPENVVPVCITMSSFEEFCHNSPSVLSGSITEDTMGCVTSLECVYRDKWLAWFVDQPKPRRRISKRTAETAGSLIEEGRALRLQGRLKDAEDKMGRAIHTDPRNAEAFRNLGEVLVYQGRISEAIAAFRRALVFDPRLIKARSNLLFVMNYSEKYSSQEIFNESLNFQKMLGPVEKPEFLNSLETNRRIRIGFISPDFKRHSVGYFFEPLLANHDSEKFELYCYSCVERPDETTDRLKRMSSAWRECYGLEDELIAKMIRDDSIDILVDLAGHTGARIRLAVFAEKPAPVQISWLGYPNTTGLLTMDYRFTDAVTDPEGESDKWHTERLVRLPHGFLCYCPPDEAPEVSPPPVIAKEFVTFGSFNMLPKLSDSTIAAWGRLLKIVPDARLILKSHSFKDGQTCERILQAFGRFGVKPDRITLLPTVTSIGEHLGLYSEVDIALDPFPYNGTTTTCEALWMGVPVISLLGDRHGARVGGSILQQLGLTGLLACTVDNYIDNAAALGRDPQRLMDYRFRLRSLMTKSALCNGPVFARDVEAAFEDMWRSWCRSRENIYGTERRIVC